MYVSISSYIHVDFAKWGFMKNQELFKGELQYSFSKGNIEWLPCP
jgi:hypothetical protein